MINTERSDVDQAEIEKLTQAWAQIVRGANPEVDAGEVRTASRALAYSLLKVVTAETLDLDAAREIGAGFESWEHLELDHLTAMQNLAMRYLAGSERRDRETGAPSKLTRAVLALGHGFYVARIERVQRLGMESMSRMSHDLKTPINAITGFSRVILKGIDGPITDFQQEDLTSIYDAGKKLLTMVNDLFAVRKRDAARRPMYGESFEVARLFADVLCTAQPLAGESGHRLIVELDGALGMMTADPSMVRWIVLSLLMYGMRQMRKGTLRVSVKREEAESHLLTRISYEPAYVDSEPVETGRPMVPQAEGMTVSDWAKEDLVLETCLNFCEKLGGELASFQSEDGVVFRISLPVKKPEALALA